jgi:hypothetical protein
MCKFYSAIVMKNGDVLHDEHVLSHEDLIALFNINDSQTNCDKFVRVEFTPPDEDYADIEKYKLNVDEENTPKWFEKHREFVTEKLKGIVKTRIILTDRKLLIGGLFVVKDCKVDRIKDCHVINISGSAQVGGIYGSAQVKNIYGSAQVGGIYGSAQVEYISGSAQVEYIYGSAQVEYIYGSAQVKNIYGSAQVEYIYDSAQVEYIYGSAQVKNIYGSAQVEYIYGSAQVKNIYGSAQVKNISGSAKIINDKR